MVCKKCGKKFTKKYSKWSNGDFCSKFCARAFVGKLNKGTKIVQCMTCGKEIEVDKRASANRCKCDNCKTKFRKKYYYKKSKRSKKHKLIKRICKVCGSINSNCLRNDICKKYQIFPALVKYFGFDKSKIGTVEVYEEFERIKNLLVEDYYDNGLSTPEMAKKYNHKDAPNFNKILKSIGIKTRNLNDAQINFVYHHGISGFCNIDKYPYKHGWHTTWNGKKVFYRSSYELDYAKKLDEKQIDYEMEKLRILYWDSRLQKQRVAIPDFYIKKDNLIVEIKSSYTYDEQNMKDKFKSYEKHGYKVKLILEHKICHLGCDGST